MELILEQTEGDTELFSSGNYYKALYRNALLREIDTSVVELKLNLAPNHSVNSQFFKTFTVPSSFKKVDVILLINCIEDVERLIVTKEFLSYYTSRILSLIIKNEEAKDWTLFNFSLYDTFDFLYPTHFIKSFIYNKKIATFSIEMDLK